MSGNALPAALTLALLATLTGCLNPTPFGAESDEHDLNRKNVERLREQVATPGRLRVVALADTHAEYDSFAHTVRVVNAGERPDLILHLGDQTSLGLLREFEWLRDVTRKLDAPLLFAIGNHDALSSGADVYRHMYGPFDYSFDYAGYHFVILNNNSLEFPDSAPNVAWLTAEVLQKPRAPRSLILASHQGPDTSDASDALRAFYTSLLASGRVALWVHGHTQSIFLRRVAGVPVLATGTYEVTRQYTRFTIENGELSFERCHFEECTDLLLSSDGPEVLAP